ncbi:MAG: VWA domain-containing protein [Bacteroidota bacterium]
MNSLNDFLIQKPRLLPVIVAVDRSGSMGTNGKMDALNLALKVFINSIKNEGSNKAEIHVALFSFGGESATCDIPLTSISHVDVPTYQAQGRTPMGGAFEMLKTLIEDKVQIPSRSYKPTIVLLTDGIPTDEFLTPMNNLINEGRSSKVFRIAMAIGDDADHNMLSKFVSSPEYLVMGESARDIRKFFRFVTMSVTQRMKSQTPDMQQIPQMPDDDTLDF